MRFALYNENTIIDTNKTHFNGDFNDYINQGLTMSEIVEIMNNLDNDKRQLEKENLTIKQTIQTMLNNERTHIGYNVLKQLMDAIQ